MVNRLSFCSRGKAVLAVALVLPVVVVRGLIKMHGDRNRSGTFSSGIAGAMSEMDRVVRPSVQHVIEVQSVKRREDRVSGE